VYGEEHIEIIPTNERRIRDLDGCPQRRTTDVEVEVKAQPRMTKHNPDYISPRELELLVLIDGHIERLRSEGKLQA
jgi:hypothetical protein